MVEMVKPPVKITSQSVKKATGSVVVFFQNVLHSSPLVPDFSAASRHCCVSISVGAYEACQPRIAIQNKLAIRKPRAISGFRRRQSHRMRTTRKLLVLNLLQHYRSGSRAAIRSSKN